MRACFMGQNVTALGYGVAILHTTRLPDPEPQKSEMPPKAWPELAPEKPLAVPANTSQPGE